MEAYSINSVEQLTGIKAHTLRIWEKRYQSLLPHRTATNIRYYDDDQLRRLLNISVLQRHGHKISALMAMDEQSIAELVLSLSGEQAADGVFEAHVNSLISHMLAFDEPSFDKICSNVIIRYGLQEAAQKVIYPFLRKTGLLWSTNNAAPSQEHFASNIIKRKFLAAIDGIPYPDRPKHKFLLFLPPDEWHEIGLLLSDFLVRSSGAASVYLGQNVPHDSLQVAVEKTRPTHLLTFFTSGFDTEAHLARIRDIAAKHGNPLVLVGTNLPAGESAGNIVYLQSPSDIFNTL